MIDDLVELVQRVRLEGVLLVEHQQMELLNSILRLLRRLEPEGAEKAVPRAWTNGAGGKEIL